MARADSVWILPWTCSVGERPCWHHSLRGRCLFLGSLYQALARRPPSLSSSRDGFVLRDGSALVHPLRSSQPRLLPHLHHRTQLQALPNSRIPTRPAVLVLRSRFICGLASVDSVGGSSGCGRSGVFEKGLTESGSQFAVYLLCPFFFSLASRDRNCQAISFPSFFLLDCSSRTQSHSGYATSCQVCDGWPWQAPSRWSA